MSVASCHQARPSLDEIIRATQVHAVQLVPPHFSSRSLSPPQLLWLPFIFWENYVAAQCLCSHLDCLSIEAELSCDRQVLVCGCGKLSEMLRLEIYQLIGVHRTHESGIFPTSSHDTAGEEDDCGKDDEYLSKDRSDTVKDPAVIGGIYRPFFSSVTFGFQFKQQVGDYRAAKTGTHIFTILAKQGV